MSVTTWDMLFNVLLLIFWVRLWPIRSREFYFNPYLSRLSSLTDKVFRFIEPVFFQAPARIVALGSLAFLIAFRCFLVKGGGWTLGMGVFWITLRDPGFFGLVAFSFLSFAMFMLNLWTFAVVYLTFNNNSAPHARGAIRVITYPFSAIKAERRPVVLLVAGMAIVFALDMLTNDFRGIAGGERVIIGDLSTGGPVQYALRLALISVSGILEIIVIVRTLMFVLIIGSIMSVVAGSPNVAYVCNDWVELFLGVFRNYPLRLGMMDLTPIIFFIALDIAGGILNGIVLRLFMAT